jgi:anti-anti-sigma factor
MSLDRSDHQEVLLLRVDHDSPAAIVRMTVSGEVDSVSADELHRTFSEAVDRHRPAAVEMNVRDVTFLDSAGIRTLLRCRAEAEWAGCHLRLTEPSRIVHRVLEISGLLEHLGLAPSPAPARIPVCRAG